MKIASVGKSRDLVLIAAAALASLILVALPLEGLIKALALLPMVLFLPGYALAAAMFPSQEPGRGERAIYAIALSVGAASLGGLVWQFAFGLDRTSWALVLAAITLVACAVAQKRRQRPGMPMRDRGRSRPSQARTSDRPRLEALTVVTALIGLAAAIVAIAIATEGLEDQRADSHFSALWIVPRDPGSDTIEVGVLNHQGAAHEYSLEVETTGRTIERWRGRLGSRQRKQLLLQPEVVPPGAQVVASLYVDGALYRRAELQEEIGA